MAVSRERARDRLRASSSACWGFILGALIAVLPFEEPRCLEVVEEDWRLIDEVGVRTETHPDPAGARHGQLNCSAVGHIRGRSEGHDRRGGLESLFVRKSRCIGARDITSTSLDAEIKLHSRLENEKGSSPREASVDRTSTWSIEVSISASGPVRGKRRGAAILTRLRSDWIAADARLRYCVKGLHADSTYILTVTELGGTTSRGTEICREEFSTLPEDGNFALNPGFEVVGPSPYLATRFRGGDGPKAAAWTAFYNGGYRVVCGPTLLQHGLERSEVVHPRSGMCAALLGETATHRAPHKESERRFFGLHQAVSLPRVERSVMIRAWMFLSQEVISGLSAKPESPADSLSIVLGAKLSDGSIVDGSPVHLADLQSADGWSPICVQASAPPGLSIDILHVYWHVHDRGGQVLLDDVQVAPVREGGAHVYDGNALSHCAVVLFAAPLPGQRLASRHPGTDPHLRASLHPVGNQLGLAVPLTASRIFRLETIAKSYARGPVSAVVLVRDKEEMWAATLAWLSSPWMTRNTNVTFVFMPKRQSEEDRIPLNALRNTAVSMTLTTFVLMLDVDMVPAPEPFDCLASPLENTLSALLPENSLRILGAPVFISALHAHPPRNKNELLNQLHHRVATLYCLNSQRSIKIDKWYTAAEPYTVRFTTDFEPFGICRRDRYPAFDERFVGYGFNKISWAWSTQAHGYQHVVLHDTFVSHHNHMDNMWVSNIQTSSYLITWRRFLAFTAETVRSSDHDLIPLR